MYKESLLNKINLLFQLDNDFYSLKMTLYYQSPPKHPFLYQITYDN